MYGVKKKKWDDPAHSSLDNELDNSENTLSAAAKECTV